MARSEPRPVCVGSAWWARPSGAKAAAPGAGRGAVWSQAAVGAEWRAGLADLAAVQHKLVAKVDPVRPWAQGHEVLLDSLGLGLGGEPQPRRKALDVGVHHHGACALRNHFPSSAPSPADKADLALFFQLRKNFFYQLRAGRRQLGRKVPKRELL